MMVICITVVEDSIYLELHLHGGDQHSPFTNLPHLYFFFLNKFCDTNIRLIEVRIINKVGKTKHLRNVPDLMAFADRRGLGMEFKLMIADFKG